MGSLETMSRVETVSRQHFYCLQSWSCLTVLVLLSGDQDSSRHLTSEETHHQLVDMWQLSLTCLHFCGRKWTEMRQLTDSLAKYINIIHSRHTSCHQQYSTIPLSVVSVFDIVCTCNRCTVVLVYEVSMLPTSSGKHNVTVGRLSVCLFPVGILIGRQHAMRPAYISARQ